MAGPFPGMDPYLEDPRHWPGLHTRLITEMSDLLNEVLPPQYVAELGERIYLEQPGRSIYPDVLVLRERQPSPVAPGGTLMVAEPDAPRVLRAVPEERHERYIEIVSLDEDEAPVTFIELLSPGNKAAGSEGRKQYLAKQEQLLASNTSLLEIDLLRSGTYTAAAPRDALQHDTQPTGGWDYLICLHRAWNPWQYEYWPVQIRQHLPKVAVPLREGDGDVALDLQKALDSCYERARYASRINYRRDPPTPFRPEDAEWADALLRERALRP